MSESIATMVDDLPESSVTTYMLNALDYVVPGEWQNFTKFDQAITDITGETDPQTVWAIRSKALALYNDPNNGYQRAMWFYQTVDRSDVALGAAAMADKAGELIPFMSFLSRLTPKADTSQSVDISVKVVSEFLAYAAINGLPRDLDGVKTFVGGLANYGQENIMRMAALVCIDGVVPLGPQFATKVVDTLNSAGSAVVGENSVFKGLSDGLPGDSVESKFSFVTNSFGAVQGWLADFTKDHNITADSVTTNLKRYIDFTDDKLDYLGAFLDMSTNYYYHTGTQTIARQVIQRAAKEG